MLKLKPEIQDKVVEFFYDIILNKDKFSKCVEIKTNIANQPIKNDFPLDLLKILLKDPLNKKYSDKAVSNKIYSDILSTKTNTLREIKDIIIKILKENGDDIYDTNI